MSNLIQKEPPVVTESSIPLKAESAGEACSFESGISSRMEAPPPPRETLCNV